MLQVIEASVSVGFDLVVDGDGVVAEPESGLLKQAWLQAIDIRADENAKPYDAVSVQEISDALADLISGSVD